MEVCVHRNIHIGRNCKSCTCAHHIGIFAWADKYAGSDFFLYTICGIMHNACNFGNILRAQPIDDHTICLTSTKFEHPFTQCSDQDGRLLSRLDTETKTIDLKGVVFLRYLFARKCIVQKAHNITHLLVRIYEWNPIPFFNNHVA